MINTATSMNSPCISVLWKYRPAFPLCRVRSPGKIDSELLLIPDAFVLHYSLRCTKVTAEFSTGQRNSFARGQWSCGVRDRYTHPVHMTEWNFNGPITGYVISADSSHMFTADRLTFRCDQRKVSGVRALKLRAKTCPWTVRVCDQGDAWERFHVQVPIKTFKHILYICYIVIIVTGKGPTI